jgi:hypothetical protein
VWRKSVFDIYFTEFGAALKTVLPVLFKYCYKLTNTLSWILIVLAHWNNSPRVDMSLHSDTLFWFRANQYLLFLLNAACLAAKQQIPILTDRHDITELLLKVALKHHNPSHAV